MKVAVCVSGVCKTKTPNWNVRNNNSVMREKFPQADFFYATWEQCKPEFEHNFANEVCHYFPEPKVEYHPYTDIASTDYVSPYYKKSVQWAKDRLDYTQHHTKQILIHAWLLQNISQDYDVVIRTRFDGFVSKAANFEQYVNDTYKHNRANCFATKDYLKFNSVVEFTNNHPLYNTYVFDHLIIHGPGAINPNNVTRLHKNKKLHAAEFGWYQVLNQPHRNHSGWVNADWSIPEEFLWNVDPTP